MTDLLRDELGFDGVTITDALDMAALAQGADGGSTSSPRSGPASTSCSRPPTPRRAARIEATLVDARGARAVRRGRGGRRGPRLAALRAWLGVGRRRARPRRRRRRRASGARRGARGALDHARPRTAAGCCRSAGRRRPRSSRSCRGPTDLTPADTSSTVAPGARGARSAAPSARSTRSSSNPPDAATIAAVRAIAPPPPTLVVVGTIDGHRQPRAAASSSRRSSRPARRPSRSPCADAVGRRAPTRRASTALATYSILPGSLDALAAALAGEAEADRSPPGPTSPTAAG